MIEKCGEKMMWDLEVRFSDKDEDNNDNNDDKNDDKDDNKDDER